MVPSNGERPGAEQQHQHQFGEAAESSGRCRRCRKTGSETAPGEQANNSWRWPAENSAAPEMGAAMRSIQTIVSPARGRKAAIEDQRSVRRRDDPQPGRGNSRGWYRRGIEGERKQQQG